MEQRADYDINRNALVCVFLRHRDSVPHDQPVETDRRRIHFKIKYAELAPEQRREIWKSSLSKAAIVQGFVSY